ncbi:uncharacterized protein LOC128669920 isoform X2 [Plodia interpunctella]|nr:uncharacterized protein LOC128669920 isoform X2 [Plodia interpunctella]
MKALIDFLKEHPDLAKGLARGRRGKMQSLKLWNQCAKKLNLIKDGAEKDRKGWSKYWCDWKYRVRRRSLELKVAEDGNRTPPDGVSPLSPLEEDILTIIGETVEGIMIKCDPLGNGDTDDEAASDVNTSCKVATTRKRKRRHSSMENIEIEKRDNNSSSVKKRTIKNEDDDSDTDTDDNDADEAKKFIRLEEEKLYNLRKIAKSVQMMASTLRELVDDFKSHIRNHSSST